MVAIDNMVVIDNMLMIGIIVASRVNYAWSVITHDRSKNKFLVINQFHIIDHVIKTKIIETIFFLVSMIPCGVSWIPNKKYQFHWSQLKGRGLNFVLDISTIKDIALIICIFITWSITWNWLITRNIFFDRSFVMTDHA